MSDSIDLSGDGGVVKTILRKAKADALCPSEDLPLVDGMGTLAETGEVFDTTRLDNTVFSFELGKGSVIHAWEIAVKTMKVGEVAKITCKPEFAYGSAGSLPDIPPGATLIFEVELVACKPRKGSSVTSVSEERARLDASIPVRPRIGWWTRTRVCSECSLLAENRW
ncbi:PEPTIDYL-PROLYL CIS-TRANS ISOMERASE FKBP20-1 [Salix koriyanagi]|uniref:peptidylprolyl isomerase n=1 Tax=Salix koriyanagi TaxID=2511006 RepID=A0A9Q0WT73_9ROSI|nr:PEPTIDYL-PROLYL CIS-TRANS ISOMERASE FKBP20-1 [Salix koriyanagi]